MAPQDQPTEQLRLKQSDFDAWNSKSLNGFNFDTPTTSRSVAHSRESSLNKLQSASLSPSSSVSSLQQTASAQGSPLSPALGSAKGSQGAEAKSTKYGHHRQTSIVHGYQHSPSRTGSIASPSPSPLSTQLIAAIVNRDASNMSRSDAEMPAISSVTTNSSFGSVSALNGDRAPPSTENNVNSIGQRRVERMHSGRRRDHNHNHSHSHSRHHHKPELKTVGEYALHVLFTSFIAHSEEKINQCLPGPLEPEPQIEKICGPGVDKKFDQLISALGHIAAPRPKPLVDSLMLWRQSKSDAANEARSQLHQSTRTGPSYPPLMQRRNTEPPHMINEALENGHLSSSIAARQESVVHAECHSIVSKYLLCRVLMEVIGQSTIAYITPDMEDKLEAIIFNQLKIASTEQLTKSPMRLASYFLFGQLLGVMSDKNFEKVGARFITDLEKAQKELELKGPAHRDIEGEMELVIGGMRLLKVKTYPEEAWDQSCDFMIALGRLFSKCHGQRLKYAYCQIIDTLCIPVAAATTPEMNMRKWTEVLSIVGQRLGSMFAKPRHWAVAFPLTATMLCASPAETFSSQWLQLILPLQAKLRDRSTRATCLEVISRLLWTYLYRIAEPMGVAQKKLDDVMKLVLPPGKKVVISTDSSLAEPLIQIIRIIGFKYPEFCFRTIVFPLINADLFAPGKGIGKEKEQKLEQLEPEKMVIGIRAFLAIMTDLEKGSDGRPPFPQHYDTPSLSEKMPTSPIMSIPRSPAISNSDMTARERLSQPVTISALADGPREYYTRFCEILGKITLICDNTFGGQATLDEKFSGQTPKTPITETFKFARNDDHHQSPSDQKQGFYELLHVAVQALPRCLSSDIPFNSLINLLCTGTAHVQYNIAESSAQSLKSIARQSHAQQVTIGFARFIFTFDDRYSTMSEGGMLGPGHIENTLKLYVELLHIWIEEIKQKLKTASADLEDKSPDRRGIGLDLSGIWAYVDEVESHGLFFLCSQSRRVRAFAVTVLRLITEFDTALGQDNVRLIHILESDSTTVMNFNDEHLSVAERSRLQRGLAKSNSQSALIELCSSDNSYDTTLWFKIFPNLIRISYDRCPFAVTLGRELICSRILQMYKAIVMLAEGNRGPQYAAFERYEANGRMVSKTSTTPPEVLIEQWKLYLIVACTTITDKGGNPPSQPSSQHARKGSKPGQTMERISNARTLFGYIIPLLSFTSSSIREAVVVGLGSINANIYKTLLEELQTWVSRCNEDARARIHQRTASSPVRNKRTDLLRTEITHVYRLTARFLHDDEFKPDDWILTNLVNYTKDLKLFLMDGDVQMDWEFQKLRRHYCGLMEELFEGINRTPEPSRWMTFESRKSAFSLMEDWCGYSPNQNQIKQREDTMRQSMIDQQSLPERGMVTAAMEIEKRNLKTAALSAMAALCGGPVSIMTESKANLGFDIRRMLTWIDTIFNLGSDRMQVIGRRALKNLIVHNKNYPYLLEHSISRCYLAPTENTKALESYFDVVTEVLLEHEDYPTPFWKLLGIGLYTLGNEKSEIRSKSAHVLRALEERQQRNSKIQDFDISISDKTKAVYKLAQFEISKRLSKQHSELAFLIFSEFTAYFKDLQAAAQRNMVAAILPWIQIVELQVDPNGGPTAQSYVLLANLFEITIKSSGTLHNEVQALWQALATGPHAGNVQLVLDFIMSLCLDRREQNFVDYAKQIVVFLSSTPAGVKVVEFLLMQITPKAMIPNEKRENLPPPPDTGFFPYLAELSEALPMGAKQAGFSLAQLSLVLLVDLMVSPVQLVAENVPLLLQVVTVLWDHYIPLVQDQAREMLIHLMHELVISQIEDGSTMPSKKSIEDFIESIRRRDSSVVWAYEDSNGRADDRDNKVPTSMEHLTTAVVNNFQVTYPGIKEQWAKLSLAWATSCPVRHLACRSFQIFRCILTSLDQTMLADMLARLSNTIADEDAEIQTFSMEILTTLRTLVGKLESTDLLNFPQLFWTTCACLDTINECEFLEALGMLEELLGKLDLSDPIVRKVLRDGQPPKWDGNFEGLQSLIHKGLRSSVCFEQSLKTITNLVALQSDDLIGDDTRLLFAVLANFPKFLHAMDQDTLDADSIRTANILTHVAERQKCATIARALGGFANSRYRHAEDFLSQLVSAIRESFFPRWDFKSLVFLMGLLTNSIPWYKKKTMRILCVLLPDIDMRKPEIASHGPDLISPLLRLLQTEYCMNALEVLDNIMSMAGTPRDQTHLRMSMTRSESKAARKEYSRTQSLFGIPEESGWSVPCPARHAETTRANVHAVFYMCQSTSGVAGDELAAGISEGGVEFHDDEFQYGYFMPMRGEERTGTMMSDDGLGMSGRGEGPAGIGDLVMKLDALDDFFEDSIAGHSPTSLGGGSAGAGAGEFSESLSYGNGAQLYDEQTLPILHQSLGQRNESSASLNLRDGFADLNLSRAGGGLGAGLSGGGSLSAGSGQGMGGMGGMAMLHQPSNTMNPGAFNMMSPMTPAMSGLSSNGGTRPSLHARSVTSPSGSSVFGERYQFPSIGGGLSDCTSDEESYVNDDVGVFSDGDEDLRGGGERERAVASSPAAATAFGSAANGGGSGSGANSKDGNGTGGNGGEGNFLLENMIRPLKENTRLGLGMGMRRLTGGRRDHDGRERERLRSESRAGMRSESRAGMSGGGGATDGNGRGREANGNSSGQASGRRGISQPPKSPRLPKMPREFLNIGKANGNGGSAKDAGAPQSGGP